MCLGMAVEIDALQALGFPNAELSVGVSDGHETAVGRHVDGPALEAKDAAPSLAPLLTVPEAHSAIQPRRHEILPLLLPLLLPSPATKVV